MVRLNEAIMGEEGMSDLDFAGQIRRSTHKFDSPAIESGKEQPEGVMLSLASNLRSPHSTPLDTRRAHKETVEKCKDLIEKCEDARIEFWLFKEVLFILAKQDLIGLVGTCIYLDSVWLGPSLENVVSLGADR